MNGSDLIKKVADNTKLFRKKMTAAGFHIIVSMLFISWYVLDSSTLPLISFRYIFGWRDFDFSSG